MNEITKVSYQPLTHKVPVQTYNRAIELDPKIYWFWKNKGDALGKLGKTAEVDAAYAKVKNRKACLIKNI
jgi:Tetratricopeptide repeat